LSVNNIKEYSTEECRSEGESGVLAIDWEKMKELRQWLVNVGLKADYLSLLNMFRKSFDKKQSWRKYRVD